MKFDPTRTIRRANMHLVKPPSRHRRSGLAARLLFSLIVAALGNSCEDPSSPAAQRVAAAFVLVGAGDIARCGDNQAGADATARVLDAIPGTVFTAGDDAYDSGTLNEFKDCYGPNWGRHKSRTRPSPGNHEYVTPGAAGYFEYFGELAGPPNRGYYSYDIGTWHILSLNSNVPAGIGSDQWTWVRDDLQSTTQNCILAYWHHPVFSSGYEGNMPHMQPIWGLLYAAHADVVVSGHSHDYERFAPQDPLGNADARGIRQFVVGTGGVNHLGRDHIAANSEVWDDSSFGVIKFTLYDSSYDWQYIRTPETVSGDKGGGVCH